MSATNPHTDTVTESKTLSSVDVGGEGSLEVTFGALRGIESPADVSVSANSGYVANVFSVSGNTAVVRIFQDSGSQGELAAVAGTDNVTDLHAKAEGY